MELGPAIKQLGLWDKKNKNKNKYKNKKNIFNWRDDEKYFYFGYGKFSCKYLKKKLKSLTYTKHERPSTKYLPREDLYNNIKDQWT